MRARVIWRSILCLGIAALITIGNAWWFAIRLDGFAPTRDFRTRLTNLSDGFGQRMVNVNIWFGSSWAHSEAPVWFSKLPLVDDLLPEAPAAEDVLPYWAARARTTATLGPLETQRDTIIAHGWPFRALRISFEESRQENSFKTGIAVSPPTWLRGGPNPLGLYGERVLPLDPIWFGFAANTMLYASVIVVMTSGARRLRLVYRRRRGRCLACGYPMGETDRCSECGASVISVRQRNTGSMK